MTLTLHSIKPKKGSRQEPKRVGRGLGSTGTYSGRGVKGQKARSGGRAGLKLKGLRKMMLSIPKSRGFTGPSWKPATVNVGDVAKAFENGATVNPQALLNKGLVASINRGVKVLGDGSIAIRITVEGCKVSLPAKKKIEAAGGKII
jgi:large subunit ribosomal protein L15